MRFNYWCKHIGTAGLVLMGLSLSGCESKVASPPPGPTEVATVSVQSERVVLTTEMPGRTSAYLVAEIRPQVNGLLQKRLFEEGTNIKAGDLLYQIDPAPYQTALDHATAALAMSEADVKVAEANLPAIRAREERLKGLVAIHAVGQQDYDDAAAAVQQAEANLAARKTAIAVNRANIESARINLSYTPIKAPISGRIGMSNITVGSMVTAYQPTPLAVVQQIDPIYVDVIQANADLLQLRRSLESGSLRRDGSNQKKVRLILEDGTLYPMAGSLKFRDVTVDPTTGSVTLRMVFSNPKQILLPGMFVRAVVEEGVKEHAILIPQQSVTRDPKGNPVALVVDKNNKVEQRMLTLDRAIADRWIVTEGLAAGEVIVVEGIQKIRAGDTVRTIPFDEPVKKSQPAAKTR